MTFADMSSKMTYYTGFVVFSGGFGNFVVGKIGCKMVAFGVK